MGKALCASIEKMNHLDILQLSSISTDEILDLECISSPHFLRYLYLRGPSHKLLEWISELHNLSELRLWYSKLHNDPLRFLHSLPNLK